MIALLRRCSLVLAICLSYTAGEIHGMGILPEGTPIVLLGLALAIVGANHAANTLTRRERRQLRQARCQVRRITAECRVWKARRMADVPVIADLRAENNRLRHREGIAS